MSILSSSKIIIIIVVIIIVVKILNKIRIELNKIDVYVRYSSKRL